MGEIMHETTLTTEHATQQPPPEKPPWAEHIEAEKDETILTGQQLRQALFIVAQGSVQIVSCSGGQKQILAEIEEGGCIYRGLLDTLESPPDQIALHSSAKTTLLKITGLPPQTDRFNFQLAQQSALFTNIPLHDETAPWFTRRHLAPGTQLFAQNTTCDSFYLILAGKVAVTQNIAGNEELMHHLGSGQYIGDHAVINHELHRHTATATTPLSVIAISAKHFTTLYRRHKELRERLKLFGAINQIPGNGFVTLNKTIDKIEPTLNCLYQFPGGQTLSITQQLNQPINTITFDNHKTVNTAPPKEVNFEDAKQLRSRTLSLYKNRLTSITSVGEWEDLNTLVLRLLTCKKPKPWELALFRQDGILHPNLSNKHAEEEIFCKCANISKGTLKQAISRGHDNLGKLADETGAAKTCGNCAPLLEELLGFSHMQLVDVASVEEVAPNIKSFRFHPKHGEFPTHQAGQHIRVQAFIDGKWVQRSYTLTSPCDQTHYYEITVKREHNGYFSRWLHDELTETSIVRISPPQGGYTFNEAESNNALIYLVAGIGVTPAIAKIRSIHANHSDQRIYLDYSASTDNNFAYKEELQKYEQKIDHLFINFRTTAGHKRINQNTIKQLIHHFPNASYIICGPMGYESTVSKYLTEQGVMNDCVHVESFTDTHSRQASQHLEKENLISAICASLALIAVLMFCLFPAIPTSASVLTPIPLEYFWTDNFTQQVTGYTMLGIVVCGLVMSIRKRIKKINAGKFVWWRIAHMLIGISAITLLFLHTGLSFGSNLNMVLGIGFVASILLGATTMATKLIDLRRKSADKDVARSAINIIHILLSSALPAVLAVHIFMTYYF